MCHRAVVTISDNQCIGRAEQNCDYGAVHVGSQKFPEVSAKGAGDFTEARMGGGGGKKLFNYHHHCRG